MNPLDEAKAAMSGMYAYFNQGTTWQPKGRPCLPITEMNPAWRRNAAWWLERNAEMFEIYYSLGEIERLAAPAYRDMVRGRAVSEFDLMSESTMDGLTAASDERSADPAVWIRTTPLYRALVDGLPTPVCAIPDCGCAGEAHR
jgi:hypothetical protein